MRRRRAGQAVIDHVRDRFFEDQRQLHRDLPGDPGHRATRLDPFDQTRDLGKKRFKPQFVEFHIACYASSSKSKPAAEPLVANTPLLEPACCLLTMALAAWYEARRAIPEGEVRDGICP